MVGRIISLPSGACSASPVTGVKRGEGGERVSGDLSRRCMGRIKIDKTMVFTMSWCLLVFGVLLPSSYAHTDFFTSIGHMTDLINTEKDLVTSLKDYIKAEESKLEQIKKWAEKLDKLTDTATKDPEGFLGHPVNAFKLMKRLNTEWSELENLVLKDMSDELPQMDYELDFHLFKDLQLGSQQDTKGKTWAQELSELMEKPHPSASSAIRSSPDGDIEGTEIIEVHNNGDSRSSATNNCCVFLDANKSLEKLIELD
uniref:Uncharacterized protein n=1 Tax=Sphaerodactylus townsendi TaxID=933632 RepID=A0ACB8F8M1_9SAUR